MAKGFLVFRNIEDGLLGEFRVSFFFLFLVFSLILPSFLFILFFYFFIGFTLLSWFYKSHIRTNLG